MNDTVAPLRALDDLQPALSRVLHEEFELGGLTGHICPVLLDSGQAAVLAQARYARGAWVAELLRQLTEKGYPIARPACYEVDAALLLSLLREVRGGGRAAPAHAAAGQGGRSTLALLFEDIVRAGLRAGASDIHLNVQGPDRAEVRYSIDGRYVRLPDVGPLARATMIDMLAVVWMDVVGGNGAVFDPLAEQQGRLLCRIDEQDWVLRWASLATDNGPSVCLRILRRDSLAGGQLRDLGFDASQVRLLRQAGAREGGAIVVAGRVGSGKSTTLATLLRGLSATRKIITLEDPVELRIGEALQNTVGRGLDADHDGVFDAKLKTIKRSAMNDVYLGEVRDRETGRAFMDLAGSGVSVYTTVHAGSARGIAARLASDFIGVPADFLRMQGVLKLLVYQELLPRPCPHCARGPEALLRGPQAGAWARVLRALPAERLRLRRAAGCARCSGGPRLLRGYLGRSVAAEVLPGLEGRPTPWHEVLKGKVLRGELDPRHWAAHLGGVQALAQLLDTAHA
ncbi:GspE/PulE family protein [Bordetella pseudohinzii]|uniref:General secretion pathway protein n=1 Tax=Bordetella pseudohinzii TaxID=1331258 RepID=A0A0J6C0F3_9BORD|nr:ATPase, T2SS/T4P/T4SS family [Bordetella pseudohinzii]ANY15353.1 general secretion pathway protein [Bordetella pseudohinzii]KMM27339.1 general secretion pathway protein [Bordetella pseudohinzii]KXA80570.1 general secretion pathway protein [Bordetella pseudohinzii]KXA82480.1 general secretion pathway protein [Bordetella pseudohinzii]CUI87138.1 Type II traffic warden ATPase [Bordetella pseudohinzii]